MSPEQQKHIAPKQEMLEVMTFLEKWYTDEGVIGRWITALGRFKMKIKHMGSGKHFNADGLSKKTQFYQFREQRGANEPKMKPGFSFFSKQDYDELEPTSWLDTNGKPNGLEIGEPAQDQPGEVKPGKPEEGKPDLAINALIYDQVQLYGKSKPKREVTQHRDMSERQHKLS